MTTLPKDIRRQINIAAHRMALRYENEVRNSLLAQLIEITDSGATIDDLNQTLTRIERERGAAGS